MSILARNTHMLELQLKPFFFLSKEKGLENSLGFLVDLVGRFSITRIRGKGKSTEVKQNSSTYIFFVQ